MNLCQGAAKRFCGKVLSVIETKRLVECCRAQYSSLSQAGRESLGNNPVRTDTQAQSDKMKNIVFRDRARHDGARCKEDPPAPLGFMRF
jgi:hypothetical protein